MAPRAGSSGKKLPCDVPNPFISREKKSRHNLAGTIKLQDPLYVMQATWDTRLWHDARDNHTRTRGDGYRLEEDMGGWERRAGERRVGSRTASTAAAEGRWQQEENEDDSGGRRKKR